MTLTRRSVWPRLRSLTLASALVALLAIPALTPAAGAQAEVDIGINEDGVTVHTSGGFDAGVVVDFSSANADRLWDPFCLEGWAPVQHPVNPVLSCLPDRLAAPR